MIVQELVNTSRLVFCALDELPESIEPGIDFLFVDDAHIISEVEMF